MDVGWREWNMAEWFCERCNRVWHSAKGECCGHAVLFDVLAHGRKLVSAANSWSAISANFSSRWATHPLYVEARFEHYKYGNSSAPAIMATFIEKLVEKAGTET
jgi:molybdenum cofactor biosynthesis enzyme MoaA